jgi:putative DNA-invertase from lambdoid prophage Rac
VRDALIGFMAALGQAQAEATKLAQRAGIAHAQANGERIYLGRKPSYSREQLGRILDLLATESDITIAKQVGLDRLAVRRIRQDPAKADAALVAWEALKARPRRSKAA